MANKKDWIFSSHAIPLIFCIIVLIFLANSATASEVARCMLGALKIDEGMGRCTRACGGYDDTYSPRAHLVMETPFGECTVKGSTSNPLYHFMENLYKGPNDTIISDNRSRYSIKKRPSEYATREEYGFDITHCCEEFGLFPVNTTYECVQYGRIQPINETRYVDCQEVIRDADVGIAINSLTKECSLQLIPKPYRVRRIEDLIEDLNIDVDLYWSLGMGIKNRDELERSFSEDWDVYPSKEIMFMETPYGECRFRYDKDFSFYHESASDCCETLGFAYFILEDTSEKFLSQVKREREGMPVLIIGGIIIMGIFLLIKYILKIRINMYGYVAAVFAILSWFFVSPVFGLLAIAFGTIAMVKDKRVTWWPVVAILIGVIIFVFSGAGSIGLGFGLQV